MDLVVEIYCEGPKPSATLYFSISHLLPEWCIKSWFPNWSWRSILELYLMQRPIPSAGFGLNLSELFAVLFRHLAGQSSVSLNCAM